MIKKTWQSSRRFPGEDDCGQERKERLGTKTWLWRGLYSNEKHSAMVICKNVMILQHNSKQEKKKSLFQITNV